MKHTSNKRFHIIWLSFVALMVFMMVFIGGITRLTDSGLSMVEWKPIVGSIPPLNDIEWNEAFDKYKAFPEYQKINHQMNLSEFKSIFFWEYFHRLFGRIIGIVFFFPFLYLVIKKRLSKTEFFKIGIAFILGGLQGLMGWYMVKSGLVDRPDVSHFRLAAHLSLAFFIIGYIYYLILEMKFPERKYVSSNPYKKLISFFTVFLFFQIIYGAFVAGLDGGLTHNTFPKMGNHWLPSSALMLDSIWMNLVENKVMIQFVHRTTGWLVLLMGFYLWFKSLNLKDFKQKRAFQHIGMMIIVQFTLGVLTLLYYVPISLASLHQIGACILLLLSVRALFFTYNAKS